jgi:hypothetical protein
MDWPGAEEIAERLRATLPPGLTQDKDAPPPPPDPMQQQMQQLEMMQVEGKARDTAAGADKKTAEAEGQKLENMQKQMELAMQNGQLQQIIQAEVGRALMGMFQQPLQQQAQPMMQQQPINPTVGVPAGF